MSSIRLYKHQINKLKHLQERDVLGSDAIRFAIRRYENNEITLSDVPTYTEPDTSLVVYSIRTKNWKYSDEKVRMILDAHFNNPKTYEEERKALDYEIDNLFKLYCNQPFIVVSE